MDSRHLRVGRPTRAFHGGGADGTSAEMPTAAEEKETALTAEIVQMDSLPEGFGHADGILIKLIQIRSIRCGDHSRAIFLLLLLCQFPIRGVDVRRVGDGRSGLQQQGHDRTEHWGAGEPAATANGGEKRTANGWVGWEFFE